MVRGWGGPRDSSATPWPQLRNMTGPATCGASLERLANRGDDRAAPAESAGEIARAGDPAAGPRTAGGGVVSFQLLVKETERRGRLERSVLWWARGPELTQRTQRAKKRREMKQRVKG